LNCELYIYRVQVNILDFSARKKNIQLAQLNKKFENKKKLGFFNLITWFSDIFFAGSPI